MQRFEEFADRTDPSARSGNGSSAGAGPDTSPSADTTPGVNPAASASPDAAPGSDLYWDVRGRVAIYFMCGDRRLR
jgi:hypothetical protein